MWATNGFLKFATTAQTPHSCWLAQNLIFAKTRAHKKLKAKGASLVDLARAEDKGQELAAARVMECSAKTQVGLKDVFDEAIKVALAARAKPAKKKGGCLLL